MSTPIEYLPPPWWRKLWVFLVKTPMSFFGYGYWFLDIEKNVVYCCPLARRAMGWPTAPLVEPYDYVTSPDRMWDQDQSEVVRSRIAISQEHGIPYMLHFYTKTVEGRKNLVRCEGHLLSHKDDPTGKPFAIYGFVKRVKLSRIAEQQLTTNVALARMQRRVTDPSSEVVNTCARQCVTHSPSSVRSNYAHQ